MFRFKLIPSKQKIMILKHYVSFQVNCLKTKNIDLKRYVSFQVNFLKTKNNNYETLFFVSI